jgi:hypothetical protein
MIILIEEIKENQHQQQVEHMTIVTKDNIPPEIDAYVTLLYENTTENIFVEDNVMFNLHKKLASISLKAKWNPGTPFWPGTTTEKQKLLEIHLQLRQSMSKDKIRSVSPLLLVSKTPRRVY